MLIDPSKIDNARILDAVMTLLVPAINRLGERVAALEAENKSLRGISGTPAPVAISPPRPEPVIAAAPIVVPLEPVEEDEEEDIDLDTPITLPPARKLEGIKRIRGK